MNRLKNDRMYWSLMISTISSVSVLFLTHVFVLITIFVQISPKGNLNERFKDDYATQ